MRGRKKAMSTAGRTTPRSACKSGKKKTGINTKSVLKPIFLVPSLDESDDYALSPEDCALAPGRSGDRHKSYLGIEHSGMIFDLHVFPSKDAVLPDDPVEEAYSYEAEEFQLEFETTAFDFGKIEGKKNGGGKVKPRVTRRA